MTPRWSRGAAFRAALLPLLAYLGLAGLALYPLLMQLQSHVPGGFLTDYFHFHWNFWWIRHALQEGLDIYHSDYVMYPYQNNLAFHTLSPFWFPFWALLEPLLGTIGAVNLLLLAAMTASGYLCYLLLRAEGAARGLALLGGLAWMLHPFILHSVYWSVLSMLGWFWLPGMMLLWRQLVQQADARAAFAWALLLGLALWGMGLTDIQYFILGGFLIIPYGLRDFFTLPGRTQRGRLLLLGALAALLGLGLLYVLGPLKPALAFDRSVFTPGSADTAFDLSFPQDYLYGLDDYGHKPTLPLYSLPLYGLTLGLAAWRYFRQGRVDGRAWFWAALALPPLILSAGSEVSLLGQTIPLPFALFFDLFGGLIRFPLRFSIVFGLALLVFAALVWSPLISGWRWRQGLLALLLLGLLADVRALRPMDTQAPPLDYAFYTAIGAEPYDYVIIDAPTAAGSGETWVGEFENLVTHWAGIRHGKKMVNGHFSRVPVENFWYLRSDDPLLSWLGQRRLLEPEPVRAALAQKIAQYPVGYLIVHTDMLGGEGTTAGEILGYLNQQDDLLCPLYLEGGAVAYRTRWHPDGCPPRTPPEVAPGIYEIDIGTPQDQRFLGWGWWWPESIAGLSLRWTGDWSQLVVGIGQWLPGPHPQAALYIDLPPAAYEVSFTMQALEQPREVELLLNGEVVGVQRVPAEGLSPIRFTLPAALLGDGQHLELLLRYAEALPPGNSSDPNARRLAFIVDRVRFEQQ